LKGKIKSGETQTKNEYTKKVSRLRSRGIDLQKREEEYIIKNCSAIVLRDF